MPSSTTYTDIDADYITLKLTPNADGSFDFKADCDEGAPMVTVTLSNADAQHMARQILANERKLPAHPLLGQVP